MDKFIDGHWPRIPDGCLTVGLRASLRLLYRAVRVLKPEVGFVEGAGKFGDFVTPR